MIKQYRKKIDKIDSEIIALLKKRKALVEKVKKIKLKENLPIKDIKREEQILKKSSVFKNVFIEILKK